MGLDKWTVTVADPDPKVILSYDAVAYGNIGGSDWCVAVGSRSLVRSKDQGATWADDSVTKTAPLTETYHAVAYGGGVFVAVGGHKTRWDGSSWSTQISQAGPGGTKWLRSVAYGMPASGGVFVAVGDAGTILTSPDGLTWTARTSPIADQLTHIAYGNLLFLVGAKNGQFMTSLDGAAWTVAGSPPSPIPMTASSYFDALTFGGGFFVGVDHTKKVWRTPDGVVWTLRGSGLGSVVPAAITFGFDTLVVVGAKGEVVTSTDAVVWTTRTSQTGQALKGIAYGKDRFVAVAVEGEIARSGVYPSAELVALECSAGPLTQSTTQVQGFDPLQTMYGVNTSSAAVRVRATSEDPLATIRVRFESGSDDVVPSGAWTQFHQVRQGRRSGTFTVTVTARNSVTQVYSVAVYSRVRTLRSLVGALLGQLWPFGKP